jgi:uncharacterized protein (TIGR03118 family)
MQRLSRTRLIACALAVAAVGIVSTSVASAHDGKGKRDGHRRNHPHFPRHHGPGYTVTPLVSDQPNVAPLQDPKLVNAWGLTAGPTTPWWVANQATSSSTLYDGAGTKAALEVAVPGGPTGTVFNGGTGFPVTVDGKQVAARFIFATLAGTIQGWPTPPPAATTTTTAVDSSASHAVYTGLAISGNTLYAADFANGKVDVWDSSWAPITTPGAFQDPYLPSYLHFAPFGIQAANGSIFVTYAKQPATPGPEVHGRGLGIIDEYSPTGEFLHRVGSFGNLNAPWGVAWAPATGFGRHSGELLVGNFGDGRINAFVQRPWGQWIADGQLRGADGHRLTVDGLWGIAFGQGAANSPTTSLYFAAGPEDGMHGLFGAITANP